jgi:predicted oxidoreductase
MVSSYLQFKLYSIKVSCVPYFRSVGVSNFNVQHLEGLRSKGLPTPSVNQIELHPWLQPRELIDYCRRHEDIWSDRTIFYWTRPMSDRPSG